MRSARADAEFVAAFYFIERDITSPGHSIASEVSLLWRKIQKARRIAPLCAAA